MRGYIARLFLMLIVSALIAFGSGGQIYVLGASKSEASFAIVTTEEKMVLCCEAVAMAEEAGANVSVLLGRLSEAGELLSLAELSYVQGDFNSVVVLADQSQAVLDGFVEEAETLREKAGQENSLDFLVNVVGSAGGTVGVVCGGVAAWFLFKKRDENGRVAE